MEDEFGILGNVLGGCPATSPDDIYQSLVDEVFDLRSHLLRGLVVSSELVRQTGVRISADKVWGNVAQLFEVRFHIGCSE